MTRPEHVTCVMKKSPLAWCGRHVANEFHFVDANHAALSQEMGNRLTVCAACAKQINYWLTHNAATEER